MWVWLQQEGDAEDAEEAALRVFVESAHGTTFVSDLLVAAAPLFSFGGTREIQLRASQMQLLGSSGDPVSNRLELSAVAEEGATLRLRPRPNHCNITPAGSEKRVRRQTFTKTTSHIPHTSQGPQFNQLMAHAAALRSRTQEFGPPPAGFRPTAAPQLRTKEGEVRLSSRQQDKQDDKPRWSAATRVERGNSVSSASPSAVPPPKPKLPSFGGTQGKPGKTAATPSEGGLTPERADDPAATDGGDGSGDGDVERDWETDFSLFYERHNPEKQQKVKELLTKHRGQESALWTMMLEKYQLTESNWREARQSSEEPAAAAETAEPPAETAEPPAETAEYPASETNDADTKDDDR